MEVDGAGAGGRVTIRDRVPSPVPGTSRMVLFTEPPAGTVTLLVVDAMMALAAFFPRTEMVQVARRDRTGAEYA